MVDVGDLKSPLCDRGAGSSPVAGTKLKESAMPYSLYREGDNAGDSGQLSRRLWPDGHEDKDPTPIVGASLMVGSMYARTYELQDYWVTTPVTEIVLVYENDGETEIIFKTRSGSVYHWRHF